MSACEIRPAAKQSLPETIADHYFGARDFLAFIRSERAADDWLYAKHLEEVFRHGVGLSPHGLASANYGCRLALIKRQRIQVSIQRTQIVEVRFGKVNLSAPLVDFAQFDHALGLGIRQRTKQHRVNDTEDRRARTNAKRQCQHGNERETGSLQELANSVGQVL